MDKRILKTKKGIKEALIRMLDEQPFEKITVSEICRESITSRITFYTYYKDKYALVDEIFADYISAATKQYELICENENPSGDPITNYELLLDSTLTLIYDNYAFFAHTDSTENPYLFSEFYNHIIATVDLYLMKHKELQSNYPTKITASLLCNGLLGVVHTCNSEKMSKREVRDIAKSIYRDLLSSKLFKKN